MFTIKYQIMFRNILKKTALNKSTTKIFVSARHDQSRKQPSFVDIDRIERDPVEPLVQAALERKRSTPFNEVEEQTFFNAIIKSFDPKRDGPPKRLSWTRDSFSLGNIKRSIAMKKRDYQIYKQRYVEERHGQLGNEIGAAHFIVYRGGGVKFYNSDRWVKMAKGDDDDDYDKNLPKKFIPSMYLECIDATGVQLYYEGLQNIHRLGQLKWLSVRDNKVFDNWCLDKICYEYSNSLEYLDISNCKLVTYHGLAAICKLKNLSKLVVENISDSYEFQLGCLMLQDVFPNLNIEGVSFLNLDKSDVIADSISGSSINNDKLIENSEKPTRKLSELN